MAIRNLYTTVGGNAYYQMMICFGGSNRITKGSADYSHLCYLQDKLLKMREAGCSYEEIRQATDIRDYKQCTDSITYYYSES